MNPDTEKKVAVNYLSTLPPLCLVAFNRAYDLSVKLPDEIEGLAGEWGDTEITFEWKPQAPKETLIGKINTINVMELGGLACVIRIVMPDKWPPVLSEPSIGVLFKKGGQNFMQQARTLGLKPGDNVLIEYCGTKDTGQASPMRVWRVKRIKADAF